MIKHLEYDLNDSSCFLFQEQRLPKGAKTLLLEKSRQIIPQSDYSVPLLSEFIWEKGSRVFVCVYMYVCVTFFHKGF